MSIIRPCRLYGTASYILESKSDTLKTIKKIVQLNFVCPVTSSLCCKLIQRLDCAKMIILTHKKHGKIAQKMKFGFTSHIFVYPPFLISLWEMTSFVTSPSQSLALIKTCRPIKMRVGLQGGGGYSHFFFIRRLGPSIYHSPQNISGISSNPPPKIEILATEF